MRHVFLVKEGLEEQAAHIPLVIHSDQTLHEIPHFSIGLSAKLSSKTEQGTLPPRPSR